jgi:hypothetical protein
MKNLTARAQKGGADIEVFSHSISDGQSEVLWLFY